MADKVSFADVNYFMIRHEKHFFYPEQDAMSSSRSDVVTHSVRSFVTKEFFLSLKSFNCVSIVFQGWLKGV